MTKTATKTMFLGLAGCLLGVGCDDPNAEDLKADELNPRATKVVVPATPENSVASDDSENSAGTDDVITVQQALRSLDQPWVGMVPWNIDANHMPSCPDGYEWIKFDDEDHSNRNKLFIDGADISYHNAALGGIQRLPSPRRAGGNTKIVYCKKLVPQLPTLAYDYAVISAANVCPAGSYRFARRWDNEDSSNHNAWSADIAPNSSGRSGNGWTWINFCFVPGQAGAPTSSPSLLPWIVFTRQNMKAYGGVSGYMYTDDEDDANNNQYSVPAASAPYKTRMQAIISAGSGTHIYFGAMAIEYKDYGNFSSCVDQNTFASILYGNAVVVVAAEGFVEPVAWGVAAVLAGVGLFVQTYCWW